MSSVRVWLQVARGPNLRIAKWLWQVAVPPKLQFFGWLAWRGRVKTKVFLHQIGVLFANASTLCVFCRTEEETINHVLLHCPLVWKAWAGILNWCDVCWVIPGLVEALLHWWAGARFKKKVMCI